MSEFTTGPGGQEPDEFELKLMQAMRRVDAPEGFAASLMERAAAPAAQRVIVLRPRISFLSARAWFSGAIAAMLLAGVFVAEQVHVRHEREQAAIAQQEFETAMRVTDHALDRTRARLERSGIRLQ
jgi:hypothetical protein